MKFQKKRGLTYSKRLARPLLTTSPVKAGAKALALVSTLLWGCLLPQEEAAVGGLVLKNRPPRILEYSVLPSQLRSTRGFNCKMQFSALVEDPDIDDTLKYRWYFDYAAENQVQRLPVADGRLDPNGSVLRGSATLKPEPTQENFPVLKNNTTHVVTLLVTDGNLDASQGPGAIPDPDVVEPGVDGGPALTNPRYSVTYSWIIDFDPSLACSN